MEKYLTYILLAGVLGLYILHFTGGEDNMAEAETTDSTAVVNEMAKQGQIYFINTDTVWANYKYVQDINADLIAKKQQYEAQMQRQLSDFEREVMAFRNSAATMSEMELQIKQNDLMKQEQELAQLKEKLELKFLQEEQEWNDKLRKSIVNYVDSFTSDRAYDYVLGYSITSNIILANDSLDLTIDVLNGLNEQYLADQSK